MENKKEKGKIFKCPICGKISVVRVVCVNGKTLYCTECKTSPIDWIKYWDKQG